MQFIKLTEVRRREPDEEIFINVSKIVYIQGVFGCYEKSIVNMCGKECKRVKETPEEIMGIINGTVEQSVDQEKPEITDDDLREMMKDPKYWRDRDPEYVRKI